MNRISGANAWNLPPIVNTLCKLNRYGRKSGKLVYAIEEKTVVSGQWLIFLTSNIKGKVGTFTKMADVKLTRN